MNRPRTNLIPFLVILVVPMLLVPAPGVSGDHRKTRNVLLDSIAWIPQNLPIPGVVAGNAVWFDYNNDGRLDILMAGMSELGPVSGIYRNDGQGFSNLQAGICPLVSEHGLSWADIDNDGDVDFAIEGTTDTLNTQPLSKVYTNNGGDFVDMNARIMGLNGGSVTWVDSDNDGHLDLLISGSPDRGNSFYTKLYRVINGQFYEVPSNLPGVWGSSIAWADYDHDGYMDVFITGYGYGVQTRLYHNAMSRGVIGFDEVYSPLRGGGTFRAVNSGGVIWFDFDNDGFVDLLVTGSGSGGVPVAALYRNNQDGSFTEIQTTLKPVHVSAAAAGDYDNDGYMDIAISGGEHFYTGTNMTTKIYHNNGDSTFTDTGAKLVGTWFGSLDWGDYDGDGRLDLLVTGATAERTHPTYGTDLKPVTMLYKNVAVVAGNSSPATPQGLATKINAQQATLSWKASTDDETDQKAITYNVMVGTAPGKFDVVSPLSDPQSGYRRMPKSGSQGARTEAILRTLSPGTYYWRVQAVDNQFAGSPFSEEGTFTVTSTSADPDPLAPRAYALRQNYPNPFNPATTIAYELPHASHVSVTVYDMLGQQVSVVVDGTMEAGVHEVRFDASGLSSGLYHYRLSAGSFVQTRSMVLVR